MTRHQNMMHFCRMTRTVIISILTALLISCSPKQNEYEEFIDGLIELQEQYKIKYDKNDKTCHCKVDFRKYFSYFDKLAIDSNWTIESYYFQGFLGSRPLLLAFNNQDTMAANLKEILSQDQRIIDEEFENHDLAERLRNYRDSIDYMTPVRILSDSGYFQFLIFALLGDNYCMFWHANYGHIDIITTKKRLREFVENQEDPFYRFSEIQKNEALKIDPTPLILTHNDSVTIRIVTLGPWEGFIERKFSITRTFPHQLRQYDRTVLLDYDCMISF